MTPTPRTGSQGRRQEGPHAARTSRLRRRGVPIAVNIAPMIDVTFLLLIFFLVTSTIGKPEGILASKMPAETGAPRVALPISPVVIRVDQTGPGPDDVSLRIENFAKVPAGFDDLARYLRDIQQQPGFDRETPVLIKAEDDVLWDHVVNAWNAAVRSEYSNIAFSGG